ncbi:hypothetical protein [Nocardia barduliensis]|uniref:hypothetical protein n=1 Tax=Nocardia barduliensis TaxID=2736643 RepID=UPI00157329DA|nr:hypothetical protein [Nocardia barduliensis]
MPDPSNDLVARLDPHEQPTPPRADTTRTPVAGHRGARRDFRTLQEERSATGSTRRDATRSMPKSAMRRLRRNPTGSDRRGAPRSSEMRPMVRTQIPPPRSIPDRVLHMRIRDVLDFFEKCPDCGYPAHASAIEREMVSGRVETVIQATCGLPCGWQGNPRVYPSHTTRPTRYPNP